MQSIQMFPDITRSLLALEQFQFEKERYENACKQLGQLTHGFQRELTASKERTPFEIVRSFRHYLSSVGIRVATQPEWECFTLCGTLLNNAGSCLGLTTLHFALSEMSNFPMRAALFEGHVVPVYMEGETPIYIETTRRSSTMHERAIQQLHGKPIKLLSNEEFIAVHLSNTATLVYARAGLLDDAVFLIDSALELFPEYTAGWINRAVLMKKIGNTKAMHQSLERAKSLHPGMRYTKAIEQIEKT